MPYLAVVHLRELRCGECGLPLAAAGARSIIVDEQDEPVNFPAGEVPEEMQIALLCDNEHATLLYVPNEISAEETLHTPEDAPVGRDAMLVNDAF